MRVLATEFLATEVTEDTEKKDFSYETDNTMKEPIPLNTWEDFEKELVKINEQNETRHHQDENLSRMVYPLFRGVKDNRYQLKSTLDRIQEGMSLSRYLKIVKIVREHIATCTGKKWDLEETNEPIHLGSMKLQPSYYEFMAYLRHNEFPSPLIDWTKSPYVAAYFAFRDIYSKAEHVSIFVYGGDTMFGESPSMWTLGPSIKTSRTHFLQQSEYSICYREENKKIYFANYEEVEGDIEDQGFLVRYDIPASERQKVLQKLDSMNITAYSLFGSEPSLMETLTLREIILR